MLGADLGLNIGAVPAAEGGDRDAKRVTETSRAVSTNQNGHQVDANGADSGGASPSTAVFRLNAGRKFRLHGLFSLYDLLESMKPFTNPNVEAERARNPWKSHRTAASYSIEHDNQIHGYKEPQQSVPPKVPEAAPVTRPMGFLGRVLLAVCMSLLAAGASIPFLLPFVGIAGPGAVCLLVFVLLYRKSGE